MSRHIYLIDEISLETFRKFSEELLALEAASLKPITLWLCSGGGETYAGLAFYGRIRNSPCHITCQAYGEIFSAATLVFAACDTRKIDSAAWFMVHDDEREDEGRSADLMRVEAQHAENVEDQWADLLSEHSSLPAPEWRSMSRKTTYLNAQQLFQFGVADEIMKGKKRA